MPRKTDTRTALIHAANRVISEQGARQLTLDAVAAAAGISKGGLLYHFPTKEALIEGQVLDLVEVFEAAIARFLAEDNDPDPRGRYLRAYTRASFIYAREDLDVSAALMYALSDYEDLASRYGVIEKAWRARALNDGIAPATMWIVLLASSGLWFSDMLEPSLIGAMRATTLDALITLINASKIDTPAPFEAETEVAS